MKPFHRVTVEVTFRTVVDVQDAETEDVARAVAVQRLSTPPDTLRVEPIGCEYIVQERPPYEALVQLVRRAWQPSHVYCLYFVPVRGGELGDPVAYKPGERFSAATRAGAVLAHLYPQPPADKWWLVAVRPERRKPTNAERDAAVRCLSAARVIDIPCGGVLIVAPARPANEPGPVKPTVWVVDRDGPMRSIDGEV